MAGPTARRAPTQPSRPRPPPRTSGRTTPDRAIDQTARPLNPDAPPRAPEARSLPPRPDRRECGREISRSIPPQGCRLGQPSEPAAHRPARTFRPDRAPQTGQELCDSGDRDGMADWSQSSYLAETDIEVGSPHRDNMPHTVRRAVDGWEVGAAGGVARLPAEFPGGSGAGRSGVLPARRPQRCPYRSHRWPGRDAGWAALPERAISYASAMGHRTHC